MLGLLAFSTNLFAQEAVDVTPKKYQFATQEVGPFVYDGVASEAYTTNAKAQDLTYKSDEGGYTYLMGWGSFFQKDGVDQGNTGYMRSMSNIIDLGGEVGKVLCFKGHNCSDDVFAQGIKPEASELQGDIEWPAIAMFLGSKINGQPYESKEYKARLSITWRICLPAEEYSDEDDAFTIRMNDFSINTKPFGFGDELKAKSYETEEDNVWCKQEGDFTFFGDDEQVPLLIKFSFGRYTTFSALLIKEIKVTINPIGDPVNVEHITLSMDETSIDENIASKYNYTVNDNYLTINNLNGEDIMIFNAQGAMVKSMTATNETAEILLNEKGVYIVCVGNETFKINK